MAASLWVLVSACALPGGQSAEGQGQQVIRLALPAAPASLDPAQARDQVSGWLVQQLYQTLVTLDSNLQPAPLLATRWTITSDGLTYTFHLRPGVRFHADSAVDSTRTLDAADVIASFRRLGDARTASPGAWILTPVDTLFALNDSTIQFRLRQPYPPFLTQLSMPYASILPREAIQQYGKALSTHPVGTGPFRFFRWDADQQIVLHRHPHYWQRGMPRVAAVQAQFVRSRLTALQLVQRGQAHWMAGLNASLQDEVFERDGRVRAPYDQTLRIRVAPQLTTEYLGFQLDTSKSQHPAARDARIRLAINVAIDRQKLVRYLRNGLALPAYGIIPPGLPGHDSTIAYPYDPARARRLLAEAGFPEGRNLPPLVLTSLPSAQNLSEFLQSELAQIGVRVQIENLEGAAGRELISSGGAPFWRASWVADYPDAENFLSLFSTSNVAPAGPNNTRFSDRQFDALLSQALAETDPGRRADLYRQAQRRMQAQAPIVPLFYYVSVWYQHPSLHGLPLTPMETLALDVASVNEQ